MLLASFLKGGRFYDQTCLPHCCGADMVSPFKKFLLMIIQGSVRMKGDQNGLGLVLFFVLFCFDLVI